MSMFTTYASVKHSIAPDFEDNSKKSMEYDIDMIIKNMQQLDFEDPCIKKKVNEISQAIWIEGHPSQMTKQKKKRKQVEETPIIDVDFAAALE